jgi:hypothetical protein
MKQPTTFLRLNITNRSEESVPRYIEEIEDSIHQLAKEFAEVTPGMSDASDSPDGEFSESVCLVLSAAAPTDDVTAAVISELRRIGIKKGYSFTLSKRVSQKDGDLLYEMKVLPNRTSDWKLVSGRAQRPIQVAKREEFPKRIDYLQDQAEQYYGAGGKDVFSVFGGEVNLAKYFESLSKEQRSDLRGTYKRIVENRDQSWIMDWLAKISDGKVSMAKAQVLYILVFLERLCDAGLLDGTKLRRVKLVDWRRLEE